MLLKLQEGQRARGKASDETEAPHNFIPSCSEGILRNCPRQLAGSPLVSSKTMKGKALGEIHSVMTKGIITLDTLCSFCLLLRETRGCSPPGLINIPETQKDLSCGGRGEPGRKKALMFPDTWESGIFLDIL